MGSLRALSLCAGGGGLDLGLRIAVPSSRVVCYVEREAYCCEVLASAFDAGLLARAPVWTDLRTFDGGAWRGAVDLVLAGFPCPPVSCAGKRLGTADHRWLWPDVERVVGEVRPRLVFLENVSGLISDSSAFGAVLAGLAALGFDAEWFCLSASDVGATHRRERVFVLAHPVRDGRGNRGELGGLELEMRAQGGAGDQPAVPAEHRDPTMARVGADGSPGIADAGLAHAARERLDGRGDAWGRRPGPEDAGEPVADAGDGLVPFARRRPEGRGRLGPASAPVGDPERDSLEGLLDAGAETRAALGADGDLPLFPPAPDDAAGWRRILAVRPDLAPAVEPEVRGAADGMAGRADRLRATGNGVVPLQAAAALVLLARRSGVTL